MSSEATGPRGSSAEREQRRAETGVAPHVSNPPLAVGVTGTLPTLASSPHGAPDLDLLEPDFFDDLRGDLEDPAVGGELAPDLDLLEPDFFDDPRGDLEDPAVGGEVAPDLDLLEPDFFDDLRGDHEDPTVSGETGNLPQLSSYQVAPDLSDHGGREDPAASREKGNFPQLLQPPCGAPSLHGSEEFDGIHEYDAEHDGECVYSTVCTDMGNLEDHDRLQAILREQESELDLSPEDQQRRLLEILHEDDGHDDELWDIVVHDPKHFFIGIGLSGSSDGYFAIGTVIGMGLSGSSNELIAKAIDGGVTALTFKDEVQNTSEVETKKGALHGDLLDTHLDFMPVSTELTEQSGEEPGRSQATAPALTHSFSPPSFGEPFVTDIDLLAEFSDQELRDRKRLCYFIKRAIRRLESPDSVANFEELALEEPARMMQLRVPELDYEIGHIEVERQKRKEHRQDTLHMEIRTKHFTEYGTLTTAGLRHYEKTSVTLIESGCSPKDYVVVDCTASKHLVMDRQDFIHGELLLFSAYNEYVPPLQVANVVVNDQVKVNVVSTEVLKQHDIQLRVGPKDAFLCCRDYAYELLVIGKIYLLKIVHPMDMARRRSAKAPPARLGSRRTRVVDIASTAPHRTSHGTHARGR